MKTERKGLQEVVSRRMKSRFPYMRRCREAHWCFPCFSASDSKILVHQLEVEWEQLEEGRRKRWWDTRDEIYLIQFIRINLLEIHVQMKAEEVSSSVSK